MSEPTCVDVSTTVSISGRIQLVKYEYSEDYFFSMGRTYSIPEDWDEAAVNAFQVKKTEELREALDDGFASPQVEALMKQRDELNG